MSRFIATVSLCIMAFFSVVQAAVLPTNNVSQTKAAVQKQSDLNTPVGYWLQYSDRGKGQSIIEIYAGSDGKLQGKILVPFVNIVNRKILPPDLMCRRCGKGNINGYRYDYRTWPKNRLQGLKIMWGFMLNKGPGRKSDGPMYASGSILDPASNGRVYRAQMYTTDKGSALNVRGFVGLPLFGRTQIWHRISKETAQKYVTLCGLTNKNTYPYVDQKGRMINQSLWRVCSNVSVKMPAG